MASYYYLMSSLPMLKSDGEMPFSYEAFVKMCENSVSKTKLELLKNLSLESKEGTLVNEWSVFYAAFKEELSYQRKQKLLKSVQAPYGRDDGIVRIVTAAVNEKNPLTAEKMLLGFQFEKLDGLISSHSFDDYALFGYALKLRLLERQTVFEQNKGKAELKRMVSGLQKQILSIGE